MAYKIGFTAEHPAEKKIESTYTTQKEQPTPRRSVVQVSFPGRGMSLAYYNDSFDLKCGDLVYVDGKLEGQLGCVTEVNYNFRIRVSDYKRVIAVVDTEVHGQFYIAGSHFVTFDRDALPREMALPWFKAPARDDDEFVSGSDVTSFCLDALEDMNISEAIAERGYNYYTGNKVRYISIDGTGGYAIVEGNENYEVEFDYLDGEVNYGGIGYHDREISGLTCSCFCSYNCKHEFAAMLQLKETLTLIERNYQDEFVRTGYFAAVDKGTLFRFAIDSKTGGTFTL